jgi:hypothetical protein
MNPGNWGAAFINKGGIKPPESIMKLIHDIYVEANADIGNPTFTIHKYIKKYFTRYLHNRIGTLLRVNEMPNLVKDRPNPGECKSGQMYIREIQPDSQYQCVMIGGVTAPNNVKIYTKNSINDKDYIEQDIAIGSLYKYSPYEHLEQNYKPDESKLGEQDMLDIFICKK